MLKDGALCTNHYYFVSLCVNVTFHAQLVLSNEAY